MQPKMRIIVPLDTQEVSQAREWVDTLKGEVGGFKIGLELMTAILLNLMRKEPIRYAEKYLSEARDLFALIGGDLFWDGKWHDIPNTLGGVAEALMSSGQPRFFNVHASSGIAAIRAAAEKKAIGSKLLAVTVLTSLNDEDAELIYGVSSKAKVIQFARDAKLAGADGLVCSPQEISVIRNRPEISDLFLMTPSVRPAWAATNDQKRIMTPGEAVKAGVDAMVIGRPITKPPKEIGTPLDAVRRIVMEIQEAEKELDRTR